MADFSMVVRVLVPATISFLIGIMITPTVTYYLYRYKAWKKKAGKTAYDGKAATEFNRLHSESEVRAPRMGGIVIWLSVLLTVSLLTIIGEVIPSAESVQLAFLSRSQTWIPLAALLVGAVIGLIDDLMAIRQTSGDGFRLRWRMLIVAIFSAFIGWWFFEKLDVTTINVPFSSPLYLGELIIPLFVLISIGLFASGTIDGIDGLSGGVFAPVFASYALIAFVQQQIDLAAFSASIVGGLLAFLWFNVPPARFYMSDTGTMALTLCLAAIAFMTDSLGGGVGITVLPIIGGVLVATVASSILQILWKRLFGRKLFRIAPIHHHFEAIGWPGPTVVMRYWIISTVLSFMGVIIALLSLRP